MMGKSQILYILERCNFKNYYYFLFKWYARFHSVNKFLMGRKFFSLLQNYTMYYFSG